MYHYRKNMKEHDRHAIITRSQELCDFCNIEDMRRRSVYETECCFVITNRVFYDVWELRDVVDHLLIIPKEHTRTLGELSDTARNDVINVMAKYEAEHYSIYARAPKSITRSVEHQHTHLIKAENKIGRGALMIKKPYVFIKLK